MENNKPNIEEVNGIFKPDVPRWQRILMWILHPIMMSLISDLAVRKRLKESDDKKERSILRNFKVEIESGVLSNKVRYIQRDKPLTDEELDAIYKE